MDDAYEIGIRLVLENGVSAGIAALQHDLAAYDRALTATTGRLRTVTETSQRLAAPATGPGGPVVRAVAAAEQPPALDTADGQKPAATVPVPAVPVLPAPLKPSHQALGGVPALSLAAVARPASVPPERALRPLTLPERPISCGSAAGWAAAWGRAVEDRRHAGNTGRGDGDGRAAAALRAIFACPAIRPAASGGIGAGGRIGRTAGSNAGSGTRRAAASTVRGRGCGLLLCLGFRAVGWGARTAGWPGGATAVADDASHGGGTDCAGGQPGIIGTGAG